MGTKGMPRKAPTNPEHPCLTGPKPALQRSGFCSPAEPCPVFCCREGLGPAPRARNPDTATEKLLGIFNKQKLKSFSRWRSKCSCSYAKSKLVKYIKINLCWKNRSRGNWMNPLPQKTQLWSLKSFCKFKLTTSNLYSPLQPFLYPRNLTWGFDLILTQLISFCLNITDCFDKVFLCSSILQVWLQ